MPSTHIKQTHTHKAGDYEDSTDSKETVLSRHTRTEASKNPQQLRARAPDLHNSSQTTLQHREGEEDRGSHPTKKFSATLTHQQRESWFLMFSTLYLIGVDGARGEARGQLEEFILAVLWGILTTLQEGPCPGAVVQYNKNLMSFWWTFCLAFFVLLVFCLF